ncbi:hypothetical protein BV22DRAFT_1034858 [Leucogyrophana mollusca]|uniref:Uncharacterized protein n=1 Tax=Leucogyrophana mollusca TaxID=85980 RepID=A0ACB8BHL2_9AGAM|nr:hypothetical protein BV22DRAFT_1034858 [Leucogyrophana mollusca]
MATGGVAAIAAPVMGPVSDAVMSTVGDSILVEMGLHTGFELSAKAADDLILDGALKRVVPIHSARLETTGVKTMTITLKYKHTIEDASLGFFRSSLHKDNSLFSAVKDYLSIEKGWFSPYLFASGRRPVIPRSVKPDVVFCHGPFLSGDYSVGEALLAESASVITLCPALPPPASPVPTLASAHHSFLSVTDLPKLSHFTRSRSPSPEPALAPVPQPPAPRRIVVLVLGLKPHRKFWATSSRPSESVIQYQLLNGCPAVVLPAKLGAPLLAWDGLTLEELWKVPLPQGDDLKRDLTFTGNQFEGIVNVLFEYIDLCVDWERVVMLDEASGGGQTEADKKTLVRDALALVIAGAVRSGSSKEVKKEVDQSRCGIAMWRIP